MIEVSMPAGYAAVVWLEAIGRTPALWRGAAGEWTSSAADLRLSGGFGEGEFSVLDKARTEAERRLRDWAAAEIERRKGEGA